MIEKGVVGALLLIVLTLWLSPKVADLLIAVHGWYWVGRERRERRPR